MDELMGSNEINMRIAAMTPALVLLYSIRRGFRLLLYGFFRIAKPRSRSMAHFVKQSLILNGYYSWETIRHYRQIHSNGVQLSLHLENFVTCKHCEIQIRCLRKIWVCYFFTSTNVGTSSGGADDDSSLMKFVHYRQVSYRSKGITWWVHFRAAIE